jgi:hypothetical protein
VVIAWAAWYRDCCELIRIDSDSCKWSELPTDGCLGVVLWEEGTKPDGDHLKTILAGHDWYFRAGEGTCEIYGCDIDSRNRDAREDIARRYPGAEIVRGCWAPIDLYHEAEQEMREAQQKCR